MCLNFLFCPINSDKLKHIQVTILYANTKHQILSIESLNIVISKIWQAETKEYCIIAYFALIQIVSN